MKRIAIALLALLTASTAAGQNQRSIALSVYSRYDKHADYTTRYGDRTYTDAIKLWGASQGFRILYLQPVIKGLKAGVGFGYSKLGIDKIRATSSRYSNVPSRTIDYTFSSGIKPLVSSDDYHYNNFTVSAGITYEQRITKQLSLTTGVDFDYLYTVSQRYHIPFDNINYKTTNGRPLGFGVNATVGIVEKVLNERYYINPTLLLPIYQQLNGDVVFREDASVKMKKFLQGAGLSISIGKYF
jgi:hypothetical protein